MSNGLIVTKTCDIAPCFVIDYAELSNAPAHLASLSSLRGASATKQSQRLPRSFQSLAMTSEKTAIIFLHAYGGCKEEIIGLALNIAGPNHSCFIYDLPGHGENDLLFNLKNVEYFIGGILKNVEDYRSVHLVGHSIGARLALSTRAEKVVAISPPGETLFEGSQTELLKTLRVRRVKEKAPYEGLKEVLSAFNNISDNIGKYLVLYAKNDIRSSREAALSLKERNGFTVKQIKGSNHLDIITALETIQTIKVFV